MRFKLFLYMLIFLPLLCCCSAQNDTIVNNNNVVTVATFNLQWLGDGIHDAHKRRVADYKRIANIIRESGADVIALQEIENGKALDKILRYLSGYKYFVADCSGAQNVAILYDSIVSVKVKRVYAPLQLGHERYRPGIEAEVKAGNFDFVMMVVHLKASSSYEKTAAKRAESVDNRTAQMQLLSDWLNSSLASSSEQDYIILGDFNDSPNNDNSDAFEPLMRNKHAVVITKDLKSSGRFADRYVIDNIVVSKTAFKRCDINSLMLYDVSKQYTEKQLKGVSDHAPVMVQFDITAPDND